jgi:hypothetical protein
MVGDVTATKIRERYSDSVREAVKNRDMSDTPIISDQDGILRLLGEFDSESIVPSEPTL